LTCFAFVVRFDVDGSLVIDDANAAAEHSQVPSRRNAVFHDEPATSRPATWRCAGHAARSFPPQLLAADLNDDSLYPELQISVKLPYRIHEIFLVLTFPRCYPSAEALKARVRSETMPSAAVEVMTIAPHFQGANT
jgi:hypothetical protein